MSLARDEAVVVYDPVRVTPEQMVEAIHSGTPYQASVVSVGDVEPIADGETDCLFLGFLCD